MTYEPSNKSHQSYMLRLWQVEDKGMTIWRSSLQETATGNQKGFESLERLFRYLREKTAQPSELIDLDLEEEVMEAENLYIKISFYRKC